MSEQTYIKELEEKIATLEKALAKEKKIKDVLIAKIERGVDYNINSASLFEKNILLKKAVEERTTELGNINKRLTNEIEEKSKAEKLLKESEKKFRTFFEIPLFGFAILDIQGNLIHFNDKLAEMLEYSREELYGLTLKDIQSAEEFEKDFSLINNLINKKIAGFDIDKELIKSNGDKIYCNLSTRLFFDETNNKEFIAAVLKDITDKKLEEENRKKLEDRFRKFTENSPVQVTFFDADGIITYVNPTHCSFINIPEEKLIGNSIYGFIDTESNQELVLNALKSLTVSSPIETHDQSYTSPVGDEKVVRWTNLAYFDENGKPVDYQSIGIDITDRILYEGQILRAKENAEKSEKLKSAFLAQMSHEIRTPLFGVLSYVSLIKEYFNEFTPPNTEDIFEYFEIISNSASRLIRTIDLILNLSEIQTNSYGAIFSNVNISAVLKNIYKEYEAQSKKKGIEFILEIDPNINELYADEFSCTQIFDNLIDNAIKYTEKGSVKVIAKEEEDIYLSISVVDSGIGMSEEYMQQLFTPFSQEETGYSRKFDGNGIGLALVKNYVEINNATITVESKKGIGSIFKVTFLK